MDSLGEIIDNSANFMQNDLKEVRQKAAEKQAKKSAKMYSNGD